MTLHIGFKFKAYVVTEAFFSLYSMISKGAPNVVILENVIWSSTKELFPDDKAFPFELPVRLQTGCEVHSQLSMNDVQKLMKIYERTGMSRP